MSRADLEQKSRSIVGAVHSNAQRHQWQAAWALVQLQLPVQPDVICYGAAMNACVRSAQWRAAHAGYSENRSSDLRTELLVVSSALVQNAQLNTAVVLVLDACLAQLFRDTKVLLDELPAAKPPI